TGSTSRPSTRSASATTRSGSSSSRRARNNSRSLPASATRSRARRQRAGANRRARGAGMDFGAAVFFPDYSIGPAGVGRAPAGRGRALEERGFESLWAPEHSHIPLSRRSAFPQGGDLPKKYYDVMDPFVTLAAAAAATTRLRVGTGVCLVVQRDPIQTAKAVASPHQL